MALYRACVYLWLHLGRLVGHKEQSHTFTDQLLAFIMTFLYRHIFSPDHPPGWSLCKLSSLYSYKMGENKKKIQLCPQLESEDAKKKTFQKHAKASHKQKHWRHFSHQYKYLSKLDGSERFSYFTFFSTRNSTVKLKYSLVSELQKQCITILRGLLEIMKINILNYFFRITSQIIKIKLNVIFSQCLLKWKYS